MSEEQPRPAAGSIGWLDLTVPDAPALRDFYAAVVGWNVEGVAMEGYEDYCMVAPGGAPAAGVCHARGPNADLPPVWLAYFVVADLDASLAACRERGGEVVAGPKAQGDAKYAVVRDPAGAHCALYQPG